jgi:hypothetical protein
MGRSYLSRYFFKAEAEKIVEEYSFDIVVNQLYRHGKSRVLIHHCRQHLRQTAAAMLHQHQAAMPLPLAAVGADL